MNEQNDLRAIAYKAMTDRGLEADFPPDAIRQLNGIAGAASETNPAIRDLRTLLWCSIDNDSSRDLDQLTVAEALPGDRVKVLVAIADVDALVKAASPIDRHARTNTTSVYTAAQIFPMLPERLSTDLTSLNQDSDRLALVVEMVVAADGSIPESDVYRALVNNRAKLALGSSPTSASNSSASWSVTGVSSERSSNRSRVARSSFVPGLVIGLPPSLASPAPDVSASASLRRPW